MNSMVEVIAELSENIKAAYLAAEQRSATLPMYTNVANLANTILSIPDAHFDVYKLQQIITGDTCELIITDNGEGTDVLVFHSPVGDDMCLYIIEQ